MQLFDEFENVFTISQISSIIKKNIEGQFSDICLKGEVSGAKKHSSGHWYLSLKDEDAVIDAVCWRGTKLPVAFEDGIEVLAYGKITTYPMRSKYQLVINRVELSGEGALLKLIMDRKEKLKKEGLFENKLLIPKFPKIIGVITSSTGSVLQDILHRIKDRYPCCKVMIWPVSVQGEGAKEQISEAIVGFNEMIVEKPDVLIIARGGGSVEDLFVFNEEVVVRATANSLIPTISAVGHETDFTLIDYASSVRAPTPTAAAEIATPSIKDLLNLVDIMYKRILFCIKRITSIQKELIQRFLIGDPTRILEAIWLRFDDWSQRLDCVKFIKLFQEKILKISLRLPDVNVLKMHLDQNHYKFLMLSKMIFQEKLQSLMLINLLSPKEPLKRGFCFVELSGSAITSKKDLNKDEVIDLTFYDGKIKTRVL